MQMMIKKKSKTKVRTRAISEGSNDNAARDLELNIRKHRLFFDKLIELIPAKFYLPVDEEKPWFQGLSKAEKAKAKKAEQKASHDERKAAYDNKGDAELRQERTTRQQAQGRW